MKTVKFNCKKCGKANTEKAGKDVQVTYTSCSNCKTINRVEL